MVKKPQTANEKATGQQTWTIDLATCFKTKTCGDKRIWAKLKHKLMIKVDGTLPGKPCANEAGDMYVLGDAVYYSQDPNSPTCEKKCPGKSNAYSYDFHDCSSTAGGAKITAVAFQFRHNPNARQWCKKPCGCGKLCWWNGQFRLPAQKVPKSESGTNYQVWRVTTDFPHHIGKKMMDTPKWGTGNKAGGGRKNVLGGFKLWIKRGGGAWKRITQDGTCTNKNGDFVTKSSGRVYMQDDGHKECKQVCSIPYVGGQQATSVFSYIDCDKSAQKVRFVFQNKPGATQWCAANNAACTADRKSKFWWIFNKWGIDAKKIGPKDGGIEWRVDATTASGPGGPLNFELIDAAKYKIQVNGQQLTYDGGCTNKHGDFNIGKPKGNQVALQPAGSKGCEAKCATAITEYSYFGECRKAENASRSKRPGEFSSPGVWRSALDMIWSPGRCSADHIPRTAPNSPERTTPAARSEWRRFCCDVQTARMRLNRWSSSSPTVPRARPRWPTRATACRTR